MQVLLADPDPADRDRTRSALAASGFDVVAVDSFSAGVSTLEATEPAAVVTEQDLGDGTGLALVEAAHEVVPDATCVLYTRIDVDDIDTGDGDAVVEYLSKDAADAGEDLAALLEFSVEQGTHTAYPLPDDEDGRLAALSAYDGDDPDLARSLDRLTVLAAELFDVASAAVGLVEAHHERFIACHGAEFGTIEREGTVCTYTILERSVTVIEDVQADPRFEDDDDLAEAGVAFYAGAPLVTDDGHAIGVFCLHDDEPRSFDDRNRELLEMFAEQAMETLEYHRRPDAGGIDDDD